MIIGRLASEHAQSPKKNVAATIHFHLLKSRPDTFTMSQSNPHCVLFYYTQSLEHHNGETKFERDAFTMELFLMLSSKGARYEREVT